jgi:hypothetical protein
MENRIQGNRKLMADDMPVVNKQTLQGVAGFLLPLKRR